MKRIQIPPVVGSLAVILVCALLVWKMGTGAFWYFGYMAAASASGALAGAAVGASVARRGISRSLRMSPEELLWRGARYGAFAGLGALGPLASFTRDSPWIGLTIAVVIGAVTAYAGAGDSDKVLSAAERAFARAAECIQMGDRLGATSALREYMEHAKNDPAREARLPAAERFLAGETDTLEVSTELQAGEAPAGLGTELSAAERPEGSGSEMVAGGETVADPGDRAGRPATRESAGGRPRS